MSTIYAIADHRVESPIPLPGVRVVDAARPDWRVELHNDVSVPRERPFHYWVTSNGGRAASFLRCGEQYVIHFPRSAVFSIDLRAQVVACRPVGRTGPDVWRLSLLNQVLPLAFGEARLVLHASAVAGPHGAIVFAGAPGRGKSTLAMALALRGMPLITDDFLVVDQTHRAATAIPSGVAARLWPDSAEALFAARATEFPRVHKRSSKRRLTTAVPQATERTPIARIFIVDSPSTTARIETMTPAQAVPALTASTFVARVDDKRVIRATFTRITSLTAHVATHRLVPAYGLPSLASLCDLIAAGSPAATNAR